MEYHMKFVMQKDKVVGSILGHFVSFKKGVPTEVPREMWAEVQAVGAIPESPLPDDEDVEVKAVHDPEERKNMLFQAFETMKERNKRGDFSASGLPNAKILSNLVGFDVGNKERDDVWAKYMAKTDEE
jgi:hypothetical protein